MFLFFFFNDTATTEIYTYDTLFPYTTLFRSSGASRSTTSPLTASTATASPRPAPTATTAHFTARPRRAWSGPSSSPVDAHQRRTHDTHHSTARRSADGVRTGRRRLQRRRRIRRRRRLQIGRAHV